MNSHLSLSPDDLLSGVNLQANSQANEKDNVNKQLIFTYYEFTFDEYDRTVKGDRKIITDLKNLTPDYLQL